MNKTPKAASANRSGSFAQSYLHASRQLLSSLERVKEAIVVEATETLNISDRLLQLTLTESEALAWQTDYPHLLFPTLAREKVYALSAWQTRQRGVRQGELAWPQQMSFPA